jgi:glycopeptide antibiotics resistance protein
MTSVIAIPLLVATEITHSMLRIQVHGGAVLSHSAGVLIGAVVGAVSLPWLLRHYRLQERAVSFGVAYALVLVVWSLRPFDFDPRMANVLTELRSEWWVPLRFISERPDLFSAIELLNNFLLYLPLGALLRVWRPQQRIHWWGLALGLAYTLLVEGAKLLVASRTVDITEAIVQVVGIVVGWAVVDRAGLSAQPPSGSLPHRPEPRR